MSEPGTLLLERRWRRVDRAASERFRLYQTAEGHALVGHIVDASDTPFELHYEVESSSDWVTRRASVRVVRNGDERSAALHREATGWWLDDEALGATEATDIDLAVTPATNTLAIRRLGLAPGGSGEATALWLGLPALDVEVLAQRYTRLDQRTYRYETLDGEFETTIEVDDLGVVRRYGDLWVTG